MFLSSLISQATELGTFTPPTQAYTTGSGTGSELANLEILISRILSILTVVGGIFFVIYFVLAAFKWITAGGDSAKIGKARDEMVQGVIGLIILVAAYGIVGLIGTIIGLDLLNPAKTLGDLTPGTAPAGGGGSFFDLMGRIFLGNP
ncbi:MAG: pilin [bacterium]|nr:pilin [bacterium]